MKVHSTVDLITNSSTVIFSSLRSNAEESIKKAILALFTPVVGGFDFDDWFEIKITRDKYWELDRKGEWEELSSEEQEEIGTFEDYMNNYDQDNYDYQGDYKSIEVYSKKTGEKLNIVSLISGVYDWDGGYNG